MTVATIVFGDRDRLAELATQGYLWAQETPGNRAQVATLWESELSATLFQLKELDAIIEDVELHHPDWTELRVLRS